ncbi:MAG: hypothetical protein ORO03_00460 [Alphaproteobacteria bacterium]|nr:hypothetical protein [Alphaproteobacteria bacterium]
MLDLMTIRGSMGVARHEVTVTSKNMNQQLLIPKTLYIPYGIEHYNDGTKSMINRRYERIWHMGLDGTVSECDEGIKQKEDQLKERTFFVSKFLERNPGSEYYYLMPEVMELVRQELDKWGILESQFPKTIIYNIRKAIEGMDPDAISQGKGFYPKPRDYWIMNSTFVKNNRGTIRPYCNGKSNTPSPPFVTKVENDPNSITIVYSDRTRKKFELKVCV